MFRSKLQHIVLAVIVMMAMLLTACSLEKEDETPPTAPLLTITSVSPEMVSLAWSESYDDNGIDEYRLYKNGETIAKLRKTEYKDEEVTLGEEYEYYVVAYDKAGNRSSRSVKQKIRINESEAVVPENPNTPQNTDIPQDPGTNSNAGINIKKLSRSTVKLYTLDNDYNVVSMGSGTIVNNNGYILTNFHCVGEKGRLYNSEGYVAIAITDDIKKNIQPQYIAQYRSGVEELDLAVVKIVADLNWNQLNATDLNLIPAKIADSDTVELGDDINILGYPGVGGETITYTAGRVSGFIDEDNDSVIDWIKTDAVVNHGNSGGTAINGNGEMIGVPTAKIVGEHNDVMFYLKPINQAIPVLKDALAQGDNPTLPVPSSPEPVPEDPVYGEGIAIYGRIVDSYTLEPIPGAAFVFLQAGVTIDDFLNNPLDSMILSYGEADRDGMFVCDYIPSGASYSVIVAAEGYMAIVEDNAIEIPYGWYEDVDLGDIYLEME
ncbi:MAG: trypsin-like serine protease [Clostridiaceae bacterium]|jgi:S1-C subfamily serine protease|nr:trypsin-like serine protease [Clostridiaceae bacterium]